MSAHESLVVLCHKGRSNELIYILRYTDNGVSQGLTQDVRVTHEGELTHGGESWRWAEVS
jgi:hypothetical protein